ncbi:MAG: enoyl-CoA hydratase-related protein [Ilumatobacteraceae bacterium]
MDASWRSPATIASPVSALCSGSLEILLGIIPGGGGTQRLSRLVGPSRAKELCLTGRQVAADEALRIGLADEVVDDPHARALELGAALAKGATAAQALCKDVIDRGLSMSLADGLAAERDTFVEAFGTEDSQIGIASFLEHGPGKADFTDSAWSAVPRITRDECGECRRSRRCASTRCRVR